MHAAAAAVQSSGPGRCGWCWAESRCPAGGGDLWERRRQPGGSERSGFGCRGLCGAESAALRLALLEGGKARTSSAGAYLCCFRMGQLRLAAATADGGEERVPASAEPVVARGSAQRNTRALWLSQEKEQSASGRGRTYRRVPRMSSAMEPEGPELGTRGRRLRGGGGGGAFLRLPD